MSGWLPRWHSPKKGESAPNQNIWGRAGTCGGARVCFCARGVHFCIVKVPCGHVYARCGAASTTAHLIGWQLAKVHADLPF